MPATTLHHEGGVMHLAFCDDCWWEGVPTTDEAMADIETEEHNREKHLN